MTTIKYDKLPEHMQDGAQLYVERGIEPGDFMLAILCDQLVESFSRADSVNIHRIYDWADWLWNDAPQECWGSMATVKAWIAKGGLGVTK